MGGVESWLAEALATSNAKASAPASWPTCLGRLLERLTSGLA